MTRQRAWATSRVRSRVFGLSSSSSSHAPRILSTSCCEYGMVGGACCFGGFSFLAQFFSIHPRSSQNAQKETNVSRSLRPVLPAMSLEERKSENTGSPHSSIDRTPLDAQYVLK